MKGLENSSCLVTCPTLDVLYLTKFFIERTMFPQEAIYSVLFLSWDHNEFIKQLSVNPLFLILKIVYMYIYVTDVKALREAKRGS